MFKIKSIQFRANWSGRLSHSATCFIFNSYNVPQCLWHSFRHPIFIVLFGCISIHIKYAHFLFWLKTLLFNSPLAYSPCARWPHNSISSSSMIWNQNIRCCLFSILSLSMSAAIFVFTIFLFSLFFLLQFQTSTFIIDDVPENLKRTKLIFLRFSILLSFYIHESQIVIALISYRIHKTKKHSRV